MQTRWRGAAALAAVVYAGVIGIAQRAEAYTTDAFALSFTGSVFDQPYAIDGSFDTRNHMGTFSISDFSGLNDSITESFANVTGLFTDNGYTTTPHGFVVRNYVANVTAFNADGSSVSLHYQNDTTDFQSDQSSIKLCSSRDRCVSLPFTGVTFGLVPLPSAAPLFGAGLMALGAVGYGLKRKRRARRPDTSVPWVSGMGSGTSIIDTPPVAHAAGVLLWRVV